MKRIISSKIYQTYIYDGPVYRFGNYVGYYKLETTALSQNQAKNNIQYRIKKDLGLNKNTKIELDLTFLTVKKEIDKTKDNNNDIENDYEQLSIFTELED